MYNHIMRAIALLVIACLLGCFPHDAHKRTLAELVEGGTLGVGVGMQYFANTEADCDQQKQMSGSVGGGSCSGFSQSIGSVGVGLILAGLVGFIVTVSDTQDDAANAGSGSGSASTRQ
jgi:hypothetical protein